MRDEDELVECLAAFMQYDNALIEARERYSRLVRELAQAGEDEQYATAMRDSAHFMLHSCMTHRNVYEFSEGDTTTTSARRRKFRTAVGAIWASVRGKDVVSVEHHPGLRVADARSTVVHAQALRAVS